MKNIFLRIALLVGIMGAFLFTERKGVQAADYATELYSHGIGRDIAGARIKGLYYAVDGATKEFTYDVYRKENANDAWKYNHTVIGTTSSGVDVTNAGDASAFITVNSRSNSSRYQLHAARLRQSLGDFSVVIHSLSGGEDLRCRKEYSFLNYSAGLGNESLMSHNEISLGNPSAEGYSYAYNFYRPRELNAQTEVAVQAGEGKLDHGGKAYYTEDGYYVRELPVTSLEKPGHSVHFQGWYDAREGGNQISAGTWCPSGTTLYARWEVVPLSYDVTCYDICGDSPDGKVLGERTWKEKYGITVQGRTLGESSEKGAYYRGYAYKGDTTAVVSTSGATVYRYFSEHRYQISFQGNGATEGNMAPIENCAYTQQVTLTKNCLQKEFCVTLDGNGENAVCETKKLYARKNFLGWSLSPGGRVAFSDGACVSGLADREGQVTLYAVWSDEKFSVNEKPQRFGYDFAGWAVSPNEESGGTQFSVEEDMTLYAVWKPGIVSYHVEYYKENLEGHYDLVSSYAYRDYVDKEVNISAEDNTFLGYFLDRHASVLSGKVRADGSLILSAFFTRNRNDVSYDINGGESAALPETVAKKYGEDLAIWDETNLKKPGYTFGGWNQEGDGKNRTYQPGEIIKMPNHPVVLYAVWVPISYEIRFDGNGAEGGDGVPQSIRVAYDEAVRLPMYQGEKSGYEFSGWNTAADGSGTFYSCQEDVQKLCIKEGDSILLFAQWQPISFEISYDANADENTMGSVKGIVENTPYSYVNESFVSKDAYYLAGYLFMGWNTKADGSGKMFAPGQNITGQIASKKEQILYAIWKAEENIGFQIEIMLEDTQEPLETVQYYGKTGEKVADALKRACKDILSGEDVMYFYPGYQVINVEELDQVIQGDHSTKCHVSVRERTCTLNYSVYQQGILAALSEEENYPYKGKAVLKKELAYLGNNVSVSRYVDSGGKHYLPGESITLERNLTLVPQFRVSLHMEEGKKVEDYCCWGKAYKLPMLERNGYRFLGWRTKEGTSVGEGKEEIASLEDMDLYPSWSEPLCYRISYDVEERIVKILEGKVSQYQYLSEVRLPDKNQVAVLLDNYEFAGWYLAGDEEQKLLEQLPSGTYGDVVLKAALVKKSNGSGSGQDDDTQKNPDDGQGDGAGGNHEKPGQSGSDDPGQNNPSQGNDGSDNKNPSQPGNSDQNAANPGQSGGLVKNPDILSQKKNPSQGLTQKKAGEKAKIGKTFWKNRLKYKITSLKKGKAAAKVVGNRYRKKQLRIPARVSYGGKKFRVTAIGKKAFRGNSHIRKMSAPSTVYTVEAQAFARMKKLTSLAFGKKLKILGQKACYGDASLRKVKINSQKLKKMGKKAFYGCKKLRKKI
ncbi:MAG: leucine-rich repeat protein [Lachnospiraceae bacterium]|nr:leucine-rich repeat protein [Lachnospiraceae bacterium]